MVFNVGSSVSISALETPVGVFEDIWRQNALAGFLVGREAIRSLLGLASTASQRLDKTWLAGINTHSIGGFYEFESRERAQAYIDALLLPFAGQIRGNLSVRLFDAEATRAASLGMNSPFYAEN